MNFVALRMLVGDRAKYLGIIVGLTIIGMGFWAWISSGGRPSG